MSFLSETKETDRFQEADHVLSWRAKLDMFIEPGVRGWLLLRAAAHSV